MPNNHLHDDTIYGIKLPREGLIGDWVDEKAIHWMGGSKGDLLAMPPQVVRTFGHALGLAQNGLSYPDAKVLTQFSPVVIEILEDFSSDTYRAMYTAKYAGTIYVLHCFKKKSTTGRNLPMRDKQTIEARLKDVKAVESAKRQGKTK